MNSAETLNLAVQHHQAGNLHEAEQLYRQILQTEPWHVQAQHNLAGVLNQLGVTLAEKGMLDEAAASFQKVLSLKPDFAEAHHNLGLVHKMQGKLADAVADYERALALKPNYVGAHMNLGAAQYAQGKLDEAVASFQQVLRLKPDFIDALNNLGGIFVLQGKLTDAVACCERALALKPDYAEAHSHLGSALSQQGKLDEAEASFRQALRLMPGFADAHSNLGSVLMMQGKLAEAVASCERSISLKPDFAEAYVNLGAARYEQGNLAEAKACYERGLLVDPNHGDSHFGRAFMWLLEGDYEKGWAEYEWRWQTKQMKPGFRPFPQPLWQGNPLPNGTILLHAEQGLGDAIQFIRFAGLVKERVGHVVCECPEGLVRLFQSCAGIDKVIPYGEPLPPFDVHAPLMSLPGIFKTTLATIPAGIPYLHANTPLSEAQAQVLNSSKNFKIGVVWQGNPKAWDPHLKRWDVRRSFSLARFEPLAALPGVRLISLQKGRGTEQLQELSGRFPIVDLGSGCNDFSDTAAVMKNLDLVISADSSPAHLAGVLGVPVWVPLPSVCCWRWLLDREDCPWYPTMKLFRQTSADDWSGVFERMTRELVRRSRAGIA